MDFREFYELALDLSGQSPNEKELSNKKGGTLVFCEFGKIMTFPKVRDIFIDNKNIFFYINRISDSFVLGEIFSIDKLMDKKECNAYLFFIEKGVSALKLTLLLKTHSQPLIYIEDSGLLKDGFFGCFITEKEKEFRIKAYGFKEKEKNSQVEVEIVFKQID